MSEVQSSTEVASPVEPLHYLCNVLAEMNADANVAAAADNLAFLKQIEGKTASDLEKIKEAKKVLKILESDDYFNDLRNTFAEHYSQLAPEHIQRYLSDIAYEQAIANVGLTLVPALYALQEEHIYGARVKPTLQ